MARIPSLSIDTLSPTVVPPPQLTQRFFKIREVFLPDPVLYIYTYIETSNTKKLMRYVQPRGGELDGLVIPLTVLYAYSDAFNTHIRIIGTYITTSAHHILYLRLPPSATTVKSNGTLYIVII
jgi:hypothetical protein